MRTKTPLGALIAARMETLGLDATALGHRLGDINPNKAAGRVIALADGILDSIQSQRALPRLANALEVEEHVVSTAVADTRAQAKAEKDAQAAEHQARRTARAAQYRENFRPHAILETELRRPSFIAGCMLSGGPARWLLIELDDSQPPETFLPQALTAIHTTCERDSEGAPTTVFFGRVLGVFINMTPDDALHYDLEGRLLEHRPAAARLPGGYVTLGRRPPQKAVALLPLSAKKS